MTTVYLAIVCGLIAVLYGFFSGGLLALPPASVASLTPDLSHFGARMGKDYIRVET